MKNGNANFCFRFYLCLLCMVLFSAIKLNAEILNVPIPQWGGPTYTHPIIKTISTVNGREQIILSSSNALSGYLFWRFPSRNVAADTTISISGAAGYEDTVSLVFASSQYNYSAGETLMEFTVSDRPAIQTIPFTLSLNLKNNTNAAQTITVSGSSGAQQLLPLTETVLVFQCTGVAGNLVEYGASPKSIVITGNPDPLLVPLQSGITLTRNGYVGALPQTVKIFATVVSYIIAPVAAEAKLDNQLIGSINVPSAKGAFPGSISSEYNLSLSPDSNFTFTVPSYPFTSSLTLSQNERNYYIVIGKSEIIDDPTQAKTSSTKDPSTGIVSTISTDNSGTTQISRDKPIVTDLNTGLTSSLGSNTQSQYSNASQPASSAANQDAANSLAGISENIKIIKENSDLQKSLTQTNATNLTGFLSQYSDPQSVASNAFNLTTSTAQQAKDSTTNLISTSLGSITNNSGSPTVPTDAYVTLKVGVGDIRTINLNPFAPDGPMNGIISLVAAFIKRLIAWALVSAFFYQLLKEVRAVVGTAFLTGGYTSQTVEMVKGVNIMGNTVGVIPAAVLRITLLALCTTLVLTLPIGIMAALEGGLPWAELRSYVSSGPPAPASGGVMLSNALGYADYVIPWRLMTSLPIYYIVVHNILFPLQVFWHMVFKFLP